ncbi:MAG: hypothetical protein WDL87_08470 [Candidatus Omnitrophota bacterium]|jgi:photosystem II stability/assembly factor-like uncharacterized protein
MKQFLRFLFLTMIMATCFCSLSKAQDPGWQNISGDNRQINSILIDPDDQKIIYAGSNGVVLKSQDGGESWRVVLFIKGQNMKIHSLVFSLTDKNIICAATGNGLYMSVDHGKSWKRVFKGKNYLESVCVCAAISNSTLYVGTKGGFFVSDDLGLSWRKEQGALGDQSIRALIVDTVTDGCVYVLSGHSVFKKESGQYSWQKTFSIIDREPAEENELEDDSAENDDPQEHQQSFKDLKVNAADRNTLFLATARGAYKTVDGGLNWELLTSYGLLDQDICSLCLFTDKLLFAATKSGVFLFNGQRWKEVYTTHALKDINSIVCDKSGNLFAATAQGLMKITLKDFPEEGLADVSDKVSAPEEPMIQEIHAAAIQYAELEPEKILRWRKAAAKKAWLPKMTVGWDRNASNLWHWESGSTTKPDDDELRRGKDFIDWDLTVSWDFSELLWNNDQTSIDTRSRLLVQLREDVLDQVTKLYFERQRVKLDLNDLRIEDRKKRFEKELKLQELAASLDALTGGFFSRRCN